MFMCPENIIIETKWRRRQTVDLCGLNLTTYVHLSTAAEVSSSKTWGLVKFRVSFRVKWLQPWW